jgi:peptidyl-prolyl cis-trans isomerase B (cyclophilin B)
MTRQRERYTERNRPYRKQAATRAQPGGGRAPDGFDNPVILIAVGGLVLAIILALGVFFGRGALNQTAGAGTPTAPGEGTQAAASESITQTEGVTRTESLTGTEGISGTKGVTATGASTLFLPGSGTPYAQPDDMKLEPGNKAYFATFETAQGPIQVELWPDLAPAHVNSFVFLAKKGFFDGLTFHRVESWVVQGGDPTGKGNGGPGYALPAEFNTDNAVPQSYGTLAMARTQDPNSGGSQFYFIKDPAGYPSLNGQYTVFGHVVSGMDVVKKIAVGDKMTKVTIEEKPISARVVSPDDIRAGKLPESPTTGATE